MKTYRVTVVRMVEAEVTVEADSATEAKARAKQPMNWVYEEDLGYAGFEVVGEPILCENPDGEEVK